MRALQLTREHLQAIKDPGVVGIGPGAPQPPTHAVPVALGQVIGDVALLVADTALDRRALAEHVAHRLAERLGAVEHAERALGRVEPARDQIRQESGGLGGERACTRASGGMRTPRCQPVAHGAGGVPLAPWGAALAAYSWPDIALA